MLALRNPLVDPNMFIKDGKKALMIAAYDRNVSVVRLLLDKKRVVPNMTYKYGTTAHAINRGSASVVALLSFDERLNPNMTNQVACVRLSTSLNIIDQYHLTNMCIQ